ncbi:Hypothetical protein Tpal_2046 [Trichococcus palustris]|uniref:Thoeris protein ThsB TIR-like domain-containing protein n=1 Tax=Trichococcus palustris TaxID=140314 RepID=A0A143YRD5_9LACT|nr:TIR domain-containing protein [Trichococcus palustris]CZQ96741.1 Hypothetical protein Tpal_2046 [Trichococcus palustris]SFK74344.1 MTH538 TIR-like domain [Trichococcus palustris]
MHKTFISYHHANEQDLKDDIVKKGVTGGEFLDKSVEDGDIEIDLSEDTIMKKIKKDFLEDASVVIVLIGEETANRPYVNSEIQTALWGDNRCGLIGVVRDEVYDKIYETTVCKHSECNCGIYLNSPTNTFEDKIPYLINKNHFILGDGESTAPHFNNSEAYCSIYKYTTFFNNMEMYIDEAFNKKDKNFPVIKRNSADTATI